MSKKYKTRSYQLLKLACETQEVAENDPFLANTRRPSPAVFYDEYIEGKSSAVGDLTEENHDNLFAHSQNPSLGAYSCINDNLENEVNLAMELSCIQNTHAESVDLISSDNRPTLFNIDEQRITLATPNYELDFELSSVDLNTNNIDLILPTEDVEMHQDDELLTSVHPSENVYNGILNKVVTTDRHTYGPPSTSNGVPTTANPSGSQDGRIVSEELTSDGHINRTQASIQPSGTVEERSVNEELTSEGHVNETPSSNQRSGNAGERRVNEEVTLDRNINGTPASTQPSGTTDEPRENQNSTTERQPDETTTAPPKKKRIRSKKERLENDRKNHKMLPPCNDKCRQKCKQKIKEEEREGIWKDYWSMELQRRRDFLARNVIKEKTAWKTRKISMRTSTFKYHFNRIRVCKTFFLGTLGYKHDRIVRSVLAANHAIGIHPNTVGTEVCAAPDNRGRHKPSNAFDDGYKLKVKDFIEKYHPSQSHYALKNAPNRRYLPIGCTFSDIHKSFNHEQTSSGEKTCSWAYFHKIISDMNISCAVPPQDKCSKCSAHETAHPQNEEQHDCSSCGCPACSDFPIHTINKNLSREHMKKDEQESVSSNGLKEVFSVDMQKVLLMPKIDLKDFFFLRKLVLFNETFASPGKGKPAYCILWHEGESGRKAYNVASAFVIFLRNYTRDMEHVFIYCDNCSAQNKNRILFSCLLRYINDKNVMLKSLKIEYLEPGHTYMPADQVHGAIARKLIKVGNIYDVQDFSTNIKKSRNNTEVLYIEHGDVHLFQDEMKVKFPAGYNMSNLKIVEFRRGFTTVFAKKQYNEPEFRELNIFSIKLIKFLKDSITKGFTSDTISSVSKQSEPRGIPKAKMDDLQKMLPAIPPNRQNFFLNLHVDNNSLDLNRYIDSNV